MARKKNSKNVRSNKTTPTVKSIPKHMWDFAPRFAREPLLRDGINKRRNALEAILKGHPPFKLRVSTFLQDLVTFLPRSDEDSEYALVLFATMALWNLNHLESALEAGDADEVAVWTHQFTLRDLDVISLQRSGKWTMRAVHLYEQERTIAKTRRQRRGKHSAERAGTSKLDKYDEKLRSLFSEHSSKTNFMLLIRLGLAADGVVVCDDTIRKRLKRLQLSRK